MPGRARVEAARDRTRRSDTHNLPATQVLRCGLGPLQGGVYGLKPVALLGLMVATNTALVAELVVRLAGMAERDHDA